MRTQLAGIIAPLVALIACCAAPHVSYAEAVTADIAVQLADHDTPDTITQVLAELPDAVAAAGAVRLSSDDGKTVLAQVSPPSLLAASKAQPANMRQLTFRVGESAGSDAIHFNKIEAADAGDAKVFAWGEDDGKSIDLLWHDVPLIRYMRETFDKSSKESIERTKKVFHHVIDPETQVQITKGPGGLYSHHRGIFYGFNKITYGDGKQADIWHDNNGESQVHRAVLSSEAGPLFGRHRLAIDWNGRDGKVFAKEVRELTIYEFAQREALLVEFESILRPAFNGTVHLDGDPQHAGFQFRASQDVADNYKDQTYYIRPDGKGKPGETRNWDHNNQGKPSNEQSTNLPFNAMSFIVDGQRYTAVYLDHPDNPKPARYSERDYGRFGSYFVYDAKPNEPLKIRYRLWLQRGELDVATALQLQQQFVDPPQATNATVTGGDNAPADNVPPQGFTALFNGKDLTGWQGFVANPIAVREMDAQKLAEAQNAANERMRKHWSVKDSAIVYDGSREGQNLVTAKDLGDFELLMDWKIEEAGDSGVYLRGTPQVQIFDPAHPEFYRHGAHLGSGSLWNNQKHARWPLQKADRPAGQWNTFRIRMVDDRVTIWLNDRLVVKDTVLENFWQRDKKLFSHGPVELQKHDGTLWFKNIYVREL